MSSRKPGQTLRENQRWLNRQTLWITLAAAPVALLLIVVFLRELVNTLMGNHSPIRAIVGWDPLESTCRHASLSIL